MSWIWHAAYVRSKSQKDVVNIIRTTVEAATRHKLRMVTETTRTEYRVAALALQFLCVSPQESRWTVFWGGTHRFCSFVFESQRLSGFLIGGEDEGIEEPDYSNYWYYVVWQEGVIADWFVWKPRHYFSEWSEEMRRKIVLPYLSRRVLTAKPDKGGEKRTLKLIEEHPEAFGSDLNILSPFLKPDLGEEALRKWLTSRARVALTQAPQILKLPFVGPEYDEVAMATYYDVKRGVSSLSPQDPDVQELYEWGASKIYRINEFQPLVFRWIDGKYRSPLLFNEFNDVFYWG